MIVLQSAIKLCKFLQVNNIVGYKMAKKNVKLSVGRGKAARKRWGCK